MALINKATFGIIGTIAGIAIAIAATQTILEPLISVMTWFPENGIIGVLAFLGLYVILALLVAPASFHKFVSGVLFGFWGGWAIAFTGACLGAILPFFITRKYLHGWMSNKLEHQPTINALKQAVGEDGLRCVALTRMSLVIPYAVLNYGYGVTDVSWKDYLLGNIGMIVPGLLYAWWGSQAAGIGDAIEGSKDWTYWAAIIASLALTAWLIVHLRKITLTHIDLGSTETRV
ncbi:MAG TPA: TVP38/TMEM64 family protein [Candidatus Poseidoniales archaeon]|jgi:uncharacterized membrane protein YdjX (TVP38/TMEM64 family)|nr:TVP38/TMEM64 family protein [Candidatus Poseidoniales archaeon]